MLYCLLTYLIYKTSNNEYEEYCYPHFTDKEAEAQRSFMIVVSWITSPQIHDHLEFQNVTLFENRVFDDIIS